MNDTQQTIDDNTLNVQLHKTPIAIVGMASVFPNSPNLREYWNNIMNEVDCITEVPASRWDWKEYYDPDPKTPDKTYSKRGGFIPEIDFNPLEFGMRPNILELTDVSQLLSLVIAREALKDAGYADMDEMIRRHTGVILGVGGGQKLMAPLIARLQYPIWERVLRSTGIPEEDIAVITEKIQRAYIPWEENSFPGMLGNVIAGRIANRFDLGGLNCVVDAACAASLAALRMAVSELASGRTNMMITGGVDTDNSIFMYMCFSKTPAFSYSQQSRPFDKNSDGMLVGEGVGMVVLKRLTDAERDGDRIYATIKGIGASSDGRFRSIYAPRPDGQALALRRAYQDANFPKNTVDLIEAHGTGTVAGDLCEFTTLDRVFSEDTDKKQVIALGSVKSQIGHTKAAAGAASLIKTALALHHKVLPPTINIANPNPKYEVENSPFYLNTLPRPWIRQKPDIPRRAGVSSFGFGGTNYHIALEEYQSDHADMYRLHNSPQSIIVSAINPTVLLGRCDELVTALQSDHAADIFMTLATESKTLVVSQEEARVGFVAKSAEEALGYLEMTTKLLRSKPQSTEWTHPKGIYYRQAGLPTKGNVVALFSGQGSQYLNMGREIALNFPLMRQVYEAMDAQFTNGRPPISKLLYPPPAFDEQISTTSQTGTSTSQTGTATSQTSTATSQTSTYKKQVATLQNTEFAQPAIGAFSIGLYKILQRAGFRADFTAGHSFGELTALWAAEVLTDADYLKLVKARGEAMSHRNAPFNSDSGTMLAVTASEEVLRRELQGFPEITFANLNSRDQVVLAGTKVNVAKVESYLQNKGYSTVLLPVSAAFHTSLVGHAQLPFAKTIDETTFQAPKIAVYSNATGQQYPIQPTEVQKTLSEQLLNPVKFKDEIENIYAAGGYFFVEFGPRNILTNLVKNILDGKPHLAVAINASRKKDSDRQFREAAVQLRVAGLPLTSIDPHQILPPSVNSQKKPPLNIKITGNSYLTDKSVAAYEAGLTDDYQLSILTQSNTVESPASSPIMKPVVKPSNGHQAKPASSNRDMVVPMITPMVTPAEPQPAGKPTMSVPAGMTAPTPIAASMGIPQQTMTPVARTTQNFTPVTPVQNVTPITQNAVNKPIENINRLKADFEQFQRQQTETTATHEQYLRQQADYTRTFTELSHQLDTVLDRVNVKAQDKPLSSQLAVSLENLGISVKQFQAYQSDTVRTHEVYLDQQGQYAEAFLRSLQRQKQVKQERGLEDGGSEDGGLEETSPQPVPVVSPEPQSAVNDMALAGFEQAMLEVVSEKTGYPTEMLTLDMDMEADLGIDSINRVEILAGVQERYPDLPKINPDDLTELRTLQEIVDYISGQSGAVSMPSVPAIVPSTPTPVPAQPVVTPANVTESEQTGSMRSLSSPDIVEFEQAMLEVVSEKTGYPTEMLTLDMDMEADLGIDSINRVEILAGVQERYPDLPKINPDDLTELRTLQEIVDYISGQSGGVSMPSASSIPTPTPVSMQPVVTPATEPNVTESEQAGSMRSQYSPEVAEFEQAMLEVVSEKTGYPTEMLTLDMDMEADLGIDSINRVEILAGVQERYPDLPKINPDDLTELRTLQEIVDYISGQSGAVSMPSAPAVVPSTPTPVPAQPVVTPATEPNVTESEQTGSMRSQSSPDIVEFEQAMLEVVSEKTGYPTEMLTLDMDMEADLGIDSINRVEILAGVQERYPDLPKINPDDLTELRTLQEIVDYISGQSGGVSMPSVPAIVPSTPTPVPAQPVVTPANVTESEQTGSMRSLSSPDIAEFEQTMLEVVSEKTGYPTEMLTLDMDMEADLGIDSINRVEILAGVQERYPDLPKINPDDLTELRTLQEIVDYISGQSGGVSTPSIQAETPVESASIPVELAHDEQPAASSNTYNAEQLATTILDVVSEKTGYPSDMLNMGMNMEADLGIDSINRVEILAGMQDHFPGLPSINPEALAELATLQEVVDYILTMQVRFNNDMVASGDDAVASSDDAIHDNAIQSQAQFGNDMLASSDAIQSTQPTVHAQVLDKGPNLQQFEQSMLEVVSEKTGYPAEMLTLDMDMEADLGIDSINRVEILAGVQERYPDLPKINPDDLTELRTLQEVVNYISQPVSQPTVTINGAHPQPMPMVELEPLPEHNIKRFTVRLKSLPAPDMSSFELSAGSVGVITSDGSEASLQLAQQLQARGWSIVVLSFPGYIVPDAVRWPSDIPHVMLSDMSEVQLQQQLSGITRQYGPIGAFIHVSPTRQTTQNRGIFFVESERALAKQIFLTAKHLKTTLTASQPSLFLTVSRLDGGLGTLQTNGFSPMDGGLFGLTKTVNQEWPTVYCRAIDIAPTTDATTTVNYILAELHDPNRALVEVGYGEKGRVTLVGA